VDELSNTSIAALENVAQVLDKWFKDVGSEVTRNLDAARATGLTAGTISAWGVRAIELVVAGGVGVTTAMLDGAALFSGPPKRVKVLPEVDTVTVDSPSLEQVKVGLTLTGMRSGIDVDASRVTLEPSAVDQGQTQIQVSVDLSGLDPDLYIGTFDCGGSAEVTPSTISFVVNP
jgi:hypothetical protein